MVGQRRNGARLADRTGTACRAEAVSKVYGRRETAVHALRDVTLDIPSGAFTAIMGPSGSGKSTLLHCLAALDTPTSGHVFLGRTKLTALSRRQQAQVRRDRIGFVFQAFNLVPTLDAIENITLPQLLAGRRPDRDWLDHIVRRIGLADRLHHRPSELSGGQQQRVALARALAGRPEVIFADEPTGNLDTAASQEMLALLRDAVDEFGQTVITVSHDPSIARCADQVLFLRDGQVVDQAHRPDVDQVLERLRSGDGGDAGPDELHAQRSDGQERMRSRRRRQPDEPTPGRPMVGSDDEVEVARQERWLQRIREQFEAEQQTQQSGDAGADDRDPWETQAVDVDQSRQGAQPWPERSEEGAGAVPPPHARDRGPRGATHAAPAAEGDDWLPPLRSWDVPDRGEQHADDDRTPPHPPPPAWRSGRTREEVPWSRPGHPEDRDDDLQATTSQWAPPDRNWPPLEPRRPAALGRGGEDGDRRGEGGDDRQQQSWSDDRRQEPWSDDRRQEPRSEGSARPDAVPGDGDRHAASPSARDDEARDAWAEPRGAGTRDAWSPPRDDRRDAWAPPAQQRPRPSEPAERSRAVDGWSRPSADWRDHPSAPPELREQSWPPPTRQPREERAPDEGWRGRASTDWRALRDEGTPLEDRRVGQGDRDPDTRPPPERPRDPATPPPPERPRDPATPPPPARPHADAPLPPPAQPPRYQPWQPADASDEANGFHQPDAPPRTPGTNGVHHDHPDRAVDDPWSNVWDASSGIGMGGGWSPSLDEHRGHRPAPEPAEAAGYGTDDHATAADPVEAAPAPTDGDDEIVQPVLRPEPETEVDDGPVLPRVAASLDSRDEPADPSRDEPVAAPAPEPADAPAPEPADAPAPEPADAPAPEPADAPAPEPADAPAPDPRPTDGAPRQRMGPTQSDAPHPQHERPGPAAQAHRGEHPRPVEPPRPDEHRRPAEPRRGEEQPGPAERQHGDGQQRYHEEPPPTARPPVAEPAPARAEPAASADEQPGAAVPPALADEPDEHDGTQPLPALAEVAQDEPATPPPAAEPLDHAPPAAEPLDHTRPVVEPVDHARPAAEPVDEARPADDGRPAAAGRNADAPRPRPSRECSPGAEDALAAALASLRSTRRPDERADPTAALQSLQAQLDRLGSGRHGSRPSGRDRLTPRRDRD